VETVEMSVPTSDWILATVETAVVGGGLVVMKLFRRSDNETASALTVVDVFGCILGGLIFAVPTTFRLTTIRWKSVLVAIIVVYLVAAFIDALVRRARRGTSR
jgi:uncharacterized membrane-anchored protein YitT (DUF2179 family)